MTEQEARDFLACVFQVLLDPAATAEEVGASIRPSATGTSPRFRVRSAGRLDQCAIARPMAHASSDGGGVMAIVAISSPGSPATRQPIRLTSRMLGPGATCEIANSSAKPALLIQPCASTT